MSTPVLDIELVKLRRRLGDTYTNSGTEITTSNIGSADGNTWTAKEVIDIYNDAVRDFLEYVVTSLSKENWYAYLAGYIQYTGTVNITNGKLGVSSLSPKLFFVVDIGHISTQKFPRTFIYISPSEYLKTKLGKFPNRFPSERQVYFTLMSESTTFSIFTVPAKTYSSCEVIYIMEHVDLVSGSSTDLATVSGAGKRKILDFAEAEAIKIKQEIVPELVSELLKRKGVNMLMEVKV